jgi:hypothetical protein
MYKYIVDITDADSFPWAGSPFLVEAESNEQLIEALLDAGLKIIDEGEDDYDPCYPRFESAKGNLLTFNMINIREGLAEAINYIKDADTSH